MDKELSVIDRKIHRSQGENLLEDVQVGDWYWVTRKDWSSERQAEVETTDLWCVSQIGSNYLQFSRDGEGWGSSFRLHFDDFSSSCVKEPNWKTIFTDQLLDVQEQIREKTKELIGLGRNLHLIRVDYDQEKITSFLPSTRIADPSTYKNELMFFQKEQLPKIQEDIKGLNEQYSLLVKNLVRSDLVKFQLVKNAFARVKDRIFTLEIYTGIQEQVNQITEGEPADRNEPISIRQQLLYMDEECLIDFDRGGMDFKKLDDFDDWLVRPENLRRILPEKRSIVGFRIRRNPKKYEIPQTLFDIFFNIQKEIANLETYLLIRNGENVYRIASAIDFSPRLVPLKDEIGEKQFLRYDRWNDDKEPEKITPDSVYYDDHVNDMDELIKKYNRIFILIQGLLDRSLIFYPHPDIRLYRSEEVEKWIVCIRDEELGLPNNSITIEEYRDRLNGFLRKGNLVWSKWIPDNLGRYSWDSNYPKYTWRESQIVYRPGVCRVTSISRDRKWVWITWSTESCSWRSQNERVNRHLKVPMSEVFNVSGYRKGDYKMFLCDRALQGRYLEWAPPLLTAEKMKLEKKRRRIEVKEEKQPGFTDPIGPNGPPFPED